MDRLSCGGRAMPPAESRQSRTEPTEVWLTDRKARTGKTAPPASMRKEADAPAPGRRYFRSPTNGRIKPRALRPERNAHHRSRRDRLCEWAREAKWLREPQESRSNDSRWPVDRALVRAGRGSRTTVHYCM